VGVARYVLEELPKVFGRDLPIDVICGTSAGAINGCHLAAFADVPRRRATLLADRWRALSVEHILRPDPVELVALIRELAGARPKPLWGRKPRGGLVDPSGLIQVLTDAIPFERIDDHVGAGLLFAASVSTTHIGTGRTVVFSHQDERLDRWGAHPTMERRPARLRLKHALASAAIPFVFPAVPIDGQVYCDGGLRQNVPLSPARRLGADHLIVVTPHHLASSDSYPEAPVSTSGHPVFPGPAFLMGKMLNAVLLDRLDGDVDRLRRINQILDAGEREFGPGFVAALNRQLVAVGDGPLRRLSTVVVRASADLGALCAKYVRSEAFAQNVKGLTGRAVRRMAGTDSDEETDLLSYLLFDGTFAGQLIALGEEDARAQHDELCELFESALSRRGA